MKRRLSSFYSRSHILVVAILLILQSPAFSQDTDIETLAGDVVYYSDINFNAAALSSQVRVKDALIAACEAYLNHPESYAHTFNENVWLFIQEPEDKAFKIYTLRLKIAENTHEYVGYVQYPDGSYDKLQDMSSEMEDAEYDILDKDYWYGSLYYNLGTTKTADGKNLYLLYGYDEVDEFTNRKVLDIMYLSDGKLQFGYPMLKFADEGGRDDIKSRLILEFSKDSQVGLNYDSSLEMIVYDNLIQRMGQLPGQGPTQYPDGSYRGLKWEDGFLVHVEKLYDQISATAPRPKPVLGNKTKKNIFGKSKN